MISKIREARPDILISGDFIVGFPEETESDFNDFPRLNEAMLDVVDDMMKYDIPHLMKKLPQEQNSFKSEKTESD